MGDDYADAFWRENLPPEEAAALKRERAEQILAARSPFGSSPPIVNSRAPLPPKKKAIHDQVAADYRRVNYIEGGRISRTLAKQLRYTAGDDREAAPD